MLGFNQLDHQVIEIQNDAGLKSTSNPFHERMLAKQRERELKISQKPKETKSKEELAQLRKDMMKKKSVRQV